MALTYKKHVTGSRVGTPNAATVHSRSFPNLMGLCTSRLLHRTLLIPTERVFRGGGAIAVGQDFVSDWVWMYHDSVI